MRSTERARREKAFHGEDDAITVDDLWEAWFESSERSWTTQEVFYQLISPTMFLCSVCVLAG